MTTASGWTEEARGPLDLFLDRVERGLLSAGVVRPVRTKVIGALEADIAERVSRAGKEKVEEKDVCATLEELGAGSDGIGSGTDGKEWRRYVRGLMPRRSRAAVWGAVCVAMSLLPMVAILVFLTFFSPTGLKIEADFPQDRVHARLGAESETAMVFKATAPDGAIDARVSGGTALNQFFSLFAPLSPLALAATLLGLFGMMEIAGSRGKVTGMATALFAMLFYPVLVVMITWWLTLG